MGEMRRLVKSVLRPIAGGFLTVLFTGAVVLSVAAQESVPAKPGDAGDTYEEIQKMIDDLEGRVGKVGEAVPPETLESLEKQVEEAVRLLTTRSEENVLLRGKTSGLAEEIESMAADRDELSKRAAEAEKELDAQIATLEQQLEAKEKERDAQITALTQQLEATEKERDEQLAVLKKRLEEATQGQDQQLVSLEARLAETTKANAEKERELERLGKQLEAVVAELATLNKALEKSESLNREQKQKIVDLNGMLKSAVSGDGKEMAHYRSEFFGKLREVLGDRQDIRIVGDRFVFQSELLFASGEAKIGQAGKRELEQFAASLDQVSATIPKEIDWVLRVDGHTDKIPVHNNLFASNWELSTARAVSVVKFLIEQKIPPNRLVAAGFGEFQPLDPRYDEIAFRRNRRIEFKLTQK